MPKHKPRLAPFVIAGISDLLDYMLIGLVPFAGDIIDFITAIMLFPYIGVWAFAGLFEIIPLVDLIPTHTAIVFAYETGMLDEVKL